MNHVDITFACLLGSIFPEIVHTYWADGKFNSLDNYRKYSESDEIYEFAEEILNHSSAKYALDLYQNIRHMKLDHLENVSPSGNPSDSLSSVIMACE